MMPNKNKGRETLCLPPSFTIDISLQYRPIIAPSISSFDIGPVIISSSKKFLVGTVKIRDMVNINKHPYIASVRIPSKIIREKVQHTCNQLRIPADCLALYNIPLLVARDGKALICTDSVCINTSLETKILPLVDIKSIKRTTKDKISLSYIILETNLKTKTLDIEGLPTNIQTLLPPFLYYRKNLINYLHGKITHLLKSIDGPMIKIIPG